MAFYRCGGGSEIPPQVKTDMNNVLNKKFGTSSQTYPPTEWADDVNLLGMLEEKTQASASICAFEDGADDVPTKSVKITIPASLSGVSSVTEKQTGRNLLAKDIVRYSNSLATLSECFAIHHGTYTVTIGTVANANNWRLSVLLMDGEGNALTDNAYNPSYNPNELQLATNRWRYGSNTTRKDFTINIVTDCYVRFFIELGDTSSSTTITDSYLEVGSTSTTYTPYTTPTTYTASLGRTIYGGQVDIVNGEGQETHAKMTFTGAADETWNWSESGGNYRVFAQLIYAKTDTNTFASNLITPAPSASGYPAIGTGWVNNNGRIVIGVDSSITSAQDWKDYLNNNNMEIAYELADEYKTDFTFTGQEVPTRLGYNAFWSDEGDTEVTYRSSGTITPVPVVPTLITKAITENGTYDAEDDDADGYSSVTVNVSGVPSGDHDDPYEIYGSPNFAMSMPYSCYYIDNGVLKKEIVMEMNAKSGYEGICIDLTPFSLTGGTTYEISLTLVLPSMTFSQGYPFGIKYSETRVPTSGSAGQSTYNIQPTESFAYQTGSQTITMQFEAHATNYLLVLLSCASNGQNLLIKMRNITIEEVTP